MKVLIADDNPTNRKLLRVVLEAEGVEVQEAGDGVEALAALLRERVDVVISDVLMPNKDGYELCYELRKNEALKMLPFIFYTNTYTSASSEKLAYEFGADGFIKKPAAAEAIVEEVRKVIAARAKGLPSGTMDLYPGELKPAGQYSTHLIDKLEQQNVELEATKERLLKINHQLLERTKALEQAEGRLRDANEELEERVHRRTRELEIANEELEAFAHTASHDLQAPLRAVGGFVGLLAERNRGKFDVESERFMRVITESVAQMKAMIDSLLELARVSRTRLSLRHGSLTALAQEIIAELKAQQPERNVEIVIADGLSVYGDPNLVRIVLTNLLGNAWKYTGKQTQPKIELGAVQLAGHPGPVCFVRDNGTGFDMKYAQKMFQAFERLHTQQDFAGSGIGLATVQRIIQRHGGAVWAEGQPGLGAVFYFCFPLPAEPAA